MKGQIIDKLIAYVVVINRVTLVVQILHTVQIFALSIKNCCSGFRKKIESRE